MAFSCSFDNLLLVEDIEVFIACPSIHSKYKYISVNGFQDISELVKYHTAFRVVYPLLKLPKHHILYGGA